MRRRTAVTASVAAVCAGVAVAIGVPLAWGKDTRPEPSFGAGVAGRLAQAPVAQPSATPTPPIPSPAAPSVPARALPPLRLSIAGAGITAPVVAVGVEASGAVSIPEDVKTVGWYRFSATPGSATGSVVLAGHVDSAVQGAGAFFRLPAVSAGDRVSLTTGDGTYVYRVVSRQSYPKPSAPLSEFFATDGAPRLTLITCGGSFDAQNASYRDNVVVTAVPIGERR